MKKYSDRLRLVRTLGFSAAALFACLGDAGAASIALGGAGNFGVLAGSTVVNTGPSVIEGDLGVSPGSSISGFPPGVVLGSIHSSDAVAIQAQVDLTTAYNELTGLAGSGGALAGSLGGLTLTPGVYNISEAASLTGTLTLDAQGETNPLFVFLIDSSFTTASGSQVALINGANADNIFFQVGSSATLGTNSSMAGSILALTSITATTGATVDGRLLARNGAITLDSNMISVPAAVPEPSSAMIVALCALGLIRRKR